MAAPGLKYDFDDFEVQKRIKSILANLDDLTPTMELIGEIGAASIQKNFEKGGRPKRWDNLADSTKAQRIKTKSWPGEILVVKGDLKKISYEASKKKVVFTPANVPYAAIQHFGGMAGKDRKTKIPARPYLLLQDEDGVEIVATLADHVLS